MRVKHTVLQKTEKTNTKLKAKSPTKSDTIYYGDYKTLLILNKNVCIRMGGKIKRKLLSK